VSELAPVLGLLAGAVAVADTVPYIRDTLRGDTRPHRGTWLVWSVIAIVACFAQGADGATWSLIMVGAQAGLTSLVFLLAIRWGEGGATPRELSLVTLAGAGVAGWLLAGEPIVATVSIVAADLLGTALMVPKTWRDPWSETRSTYTLASVSGGLAVGAVGTFDPALLLFPVYYCLANGAIAVLIGSRRAALASGAVAA
jgi:hypothetical protein